jgi:hypothetical protein
MPRDDEEILKLKERIRELEEEIAKLKGCNRELEGENEELKKSRDRARGVPAEDLVAQMTGGERTKRYKDLYDVKTKKGTRIEVKLSKVHHMSTKTKRWTWNAVLGPKQYDFLVLAGDRDTRYRERYPPDLDYVFFLIPRSAVEEINSRGDCIALNTNFATARAPKSNILIERYLVHSQAEFKNL